MAKTNNLERGNITTTEDLVHWKIKNRPCVINTLDLKSRVYMRQTINFIWQH